MSETTLKDLERGTVIVYRVHPDSAPQYGLFRRLTPSGKYAIIENDKESVYRTETVHVLEVMPSRKPVQQQQQQPGNGTDGNNGKNEGEEQAHN